MFSRSIEGAEVGEQCQKVYEKAITVNYSTEKLTVTSCKDGRVQNTVHIMPASAQRSHEPKTREQRTKD